MTISQFILSKIARLKLPTKLFVTHQIYVLTNAKTCLFTVYIVKPRIYLLSTLSSTYTPDFERQKQVICTSIKQRHEHKLLFFNKKTHYHLIVLRIFRNRRSKIKFWLAAKNLDFPGWFTQKNALIQYKPTT